MKEGRNRAKEHNERNPILFVRVGLENISKRDPSLRKQGILQKLRSVDLPTFIRPWKELTAIKTRLLLTYVERGNSSCQNALHLSGLSVACLKVEEKKKKNFTFLDDDDDDAAACCCSLSISTVFCSCVSASRLVDRTWSIRATWAPSSLLFCTSVSYLVRRELNSWNKRRQRGKWVQGKPSRHSLRWKQAFCSW